MSLVSTDRLPQVPAALRELFPLPMTPLEAFMVADTSVDYPMLCEFELRFHGQIQRSAFESALAFAVPRNPLFTCRIEPRGNNWVWITTDWMPPVRWHSPDDPSEDLFNRPMDLASEPGLRLWVIAGQSESRLVLQFHHACSDAGGVGAFVEDLLAAYAAAIPGTPEVAPRPLDPTRLALRGEAGLAGRGWMRKIGDALAGIREGAKFFLQAPKPLMAAPPTAQRAQPATAFPTYCSVDCPQALVSDLRRYAAAHDATLNDVLLRDMFLALRRWNANTKASGSGKRMRLLMPQNLREPIDHLMPTANLISFAFVTRTNRQCDDPVALLHSIREETAAVRRGKLSLYFVGGLGSLQSAGLLPRVLNSNLCFSTAILTNIGHPLRHFVARFPSTEQGLVAGDIVLHRMVGVPPARQHTHLGVSIANNLNQLSLTAKWDAHRYQLADARWFLDDYLVQLRATALQAQEAVRAE